MYKAEVGDDVYGEDPTVNRLQEACAQITGKEDALFVASGTMGNLVSLLTHCGRGDEVILGDRSHIFLYEQGGSSSLGGIHPRTLPNESDGTLAPEAVARAIRLDDPHCPRSRLLCLENTWNGRVLHPHYMAEIARTVRPRGLAIHLDGARIFNASVALGLSVAKLAAEVDSIQFCFSKGLAAPAGSIVCGTAPFIKEARRARKVVGGAMRQVGVLAAACQVALDTMVDRMADDHANARRLAEGLAEIPGIKIDLGSVETNIVFFSFESAALTARHFVERLACREILMLDTSANDVRAVTHYAIEAGDIDKAILSVRDCLVEANALCVPA
jgi:threonine aldolase